jgi:hypothetical protein
MNNLSRLLEPDEGRDALRKLAGLLIGTGLLMTFTRKADSALGETWGDWGLLIVLLIAFGFLYGGGLLGRLNTDGLRSWEAVYLVFGIFLAPLVLFQFIEAINGSPGSSLNVFWVFLVTAGLAAAATLLTGLRYGLLLASLAVIVSWSAIWNKIVSDGIGAHLGTYRGLLLILAVLLVGAAVAIWRTDPREGPTRANEIVTGAAVSAVIAGSLSITKVFALSNPLLAVPTADSSLFWEIVLLVVSLLAIAYGSRFGVRGPAYVGGIGLFLFVLIAGTDLNEATPQGKFVGWPLVLVLVGAAAFAASLIPGLQIGPLEGDRLGSPAGAGSPPSPQPPSGSPPPPRPPAGSPPPAA